MSYQHFSTANRYKLWFYLNEGRTLAFAARQLGYNLSTVWREIQRNRLDYNDLINSPVSIKRITNKFHYDAEVAIYKARARRQMIGRTRRKIIHNTRLQNYITKHLRQHWSPEQIVGVLKKYCIIPDKKKHPITVATQTIYDFIYNDCPELKQYLRRKRKHKSYKSYFGRHYKGRLHSIDARPRYINKRQTLGHWEGDTIMGSQHGNTGRIATFVERKSGYLVAIKLPAPIQNLDSVQDDFSLSYRFADGFITAIRAQIQPKYIKTLTLDNGPENSAYKYLESQMKGLAIYFAHPYHSWERGTNENTNGLLRQYFPKGMDFRKITQADIDKVVMEINNRPRKRLNWSTPRQVMKRNNALCTSD